MRLQKLQIAGFKSFSDRSELSFDRGVTAIVGPNGCGKSNVADAIVWVLGEQSAKSLRGDQMQDVIFNGSEARKPTAAAEVRLMLSEVTNANRLLDDEEQNEIARNVEVTRRLYRSGDSEYLINGEQCRLKDVHELLMDTGLGAKAYAIIEQGKIGQILSSRPTDRRQLIEEAAGVTKYKARRRAAELKLEASQQNLTRIDDIIFEVEKQRAALKRQAAKARRYRRLREELRRWEKVLFARRYRVLAEAIEAARAKLAARRAEEAAAAARLAAAEDALSRTRLELARAEAHAGTQREAAHACELEIDRRQNQIDLGRQGLENLVARRGDIADELRGIEARHEPALRAVEERREAAGKAAAERDEAAGVLERATTEYAEASRSAHALEADVEARRQALFVVQSAISSLQHAIEGARAARERVGDDLARLQAEETDVETEEARLAEERSSVRARLGEAETAVERLAADVELQRRELGDAREELDLQRRETRSREQELASVEARLASLEELEAGRAQYGEGARLILAGDGPIPHRGSLADCLEVERGYERAVEGYLGDRLQHVLVDDHATAERGLAAVREHRAGRCGFLVVGDGEDQRGPVPAGPPVEGLSPLASVVRITGGPPALVERAIGRAWMAASFSAAAAAAGRTEDPVVTPEGDVFTGPHLVHGGAREESRGILSTKGEIRELRDRAARLREGLEALGERTAQVEGTIARLTSSIAALEADGHRQEKVIVGLEAQSAKVEENADRLRRRSELLRIERARAEEQRRALEAREHEAAVQVERKHAERVAADEGLGVGQRDLTAARLAAEAVGRRAADARALHAGLVERATALVTDVARLEEALVELRAREAARREEASQNESRQAELRLAIEDGRRRLDENVLELERLREAVRRADEALAERHADADAQEGEIRTARAGLDTLRADLSELDVSRATAEGDLAHLAALCEESVQQPLDAVVAEVERAEREGQPAPGAVATEAEEPEEDGGPAEGTQEAGIAQPDQEAAVVQAAPRREPETPEEAIAALKERIDRLGPVNMMAIEQFDELEGRHTFLTAQRQDLRDSIAATGEAIRRIDETSKERFREAFTVINENFQETFTILFGGGRAGLALVNDADVLESGIEIVAQPPGKRLQNVQLLSGGEKALTAIALMFAIFRYKPSPFCVLDEIDAPLDDANIGRFVDLLKQMQDQTQFIIITHSRKTMEIADRLYGVTMEEPGVSKLISVRLN
jgi:chromosome segregation protein